MFDECGATGQQRTSAVLFSRAFRPGLAACGWASDAYVPLAASSLQTGKARTAGLNSMLTPPLYGASLLLQALCAGVCFPTFQAHLSITGRLFSGNTAVPAQLGLSNICLCEALGCFRIIKSCF